MNYINYMPCLPYNDRAMHCSLIIRYTVRYRYTVITGPALPLNYTVRYRYTVMTGTWAASKLHGTRYGTGTG